MLNTWDADTETWEIRRINRNNIKLFRINRNCHLIHLTKSEEKSQSWSWWGRVKWTCWYEVEEKQRRSYIVNQEHIQLLWSSEGIVKQITEYLWTNTKCEKSEVNHMFLKICYMSLIRDRNALRLSLK